MSKLSKVSQFINPVSFWKHFWLFIVSLNIAYFLYILEGDIVCVISDIYLNRPSIFILISLLVILLFILVGFFIRPQAQFKTQEIHNQPSWVYYCYWGVLNGLLYWSILMFFVEYRVYWWKGSWKINLVLCLVILMAKYFNEKISKPINLNFKSFAAGSVGSTDDKLNFLVSAKNAAVGLKKLDDYVNVVGLYGGLGYGKSSYARMIIESFEPNENLYTYISLTETNEAKDFSKLFAERWLETIAERYPKIDISSYLPFMQSILRESGNGILSDILFMLSALNLGLMKTRAVVFDKFYNKKDRINYTSTSVGKIFCNIPEITEKNWIIMIDEIERAQFDEIYRIIEIVERFKNEGRSGLPIKLIFIFCISEPEFSEYLKTFEKNDPRVYSIRTFFYDDPKSISHRIFLPPVDPQLKQSYLNDMLNDIIDEEKISTPPEVTPNTINDPTISYLADQRESLGYIIALLSECSPRIINRIGVALRLFYNSFKSSVGESQNNAIRFSDIVALEFIKIKYPYLIDFFLKTNKYLISKNEASNVDVFLLKEKFEKSNIDLIGWIENSVGIKIDISKKAEIMSLVGLVMYYYFDFLNNDHGNKDKIQYFGTTSYPEIMNDYLSLVSDSIDTGYRKYNKFYQQHINFQGNKLIKNLNNIDLIGYARFLNGISGRQNKNLKIDILHELGQRLLFNKICIDPMNVGDTELDEATYQFIFLILKSINENKSKDGPDDELRDILGILKKILISEKVSIVTKFIILNSFANNERGSDTEVHQDLEFGFQRLYKYFEEDIKQMIKYVFDDADDRYYFGNSKKVIYENEENFFYLLYQNWSGSNESKIEIHQIRNVAARGLSNYSRALELYWNRFPYKEGWKSYDDVLEDDRFFINTINNHNLYMPIRTLIEITNNSLVAGNELKAKANFWYSIINDPRFIKNAKINNDTSTLRAVLEKRGFLDSR